MEQPIPSDTEHIEFNPEKTITRLRLQYVQVILAFIGISSVLLLLFAFQILSLEEVGITIGVGTAALAGLGLIWLRQYIQPVIQLSVVLLFIVDFSIQNDDVFLITMMMLTMVSAALLANEWVYRFAQGAMVVRLFFHIIEVQARLDVEFISTEIAVTLILGLSPFALGWGVRYFANALQGTIQRSSRTAILLEGSSSIGHVLSGVLDEQELLPRATELIRDRFAYYHVQVFMIDSQRQQAVLVASTGDAGEALMKQNHRLTIGSESVIGQTTLAGRPIIVNDTESEGFHAYNALLPYTRSEIGLPLFDGDKILGVLDVQSTRKNAFGAVDIQALQVMASQLSNAIRNARLFEAQKQGAEENRRLVDRLREAIRQVERLNERLTTRVWSTYLDKQANELGVEVDFADNLIGGIADDTAWTPTLTEAVQNNAIVQNSDANKQIIAVPLRVQGQVVGAMEFELDEHEQFSPESLDLIQEVGERFGQAAENVRLLEESQLVAQRESMVNEMSARLQLSSTVEETLSTAARSLQDLFRARHVVIRLGRPEQSPQATSEGES